MGKLQEGELELLLLKSFCVVSRESTVWLLNSLFLLFLVINSDFAFIEDFSNFVFAFIFLDFRVNKAVANKLLNDSKLNKNNIYIYIYILK